MIRVRHVGLDICLSTGSKGSNASSYTRRKFDVRRLAVVTGLCQKFLQQKDIRTHDFAEPLRANGT